MNYDLWNTKAATTYQNLRQTILHASLSTVISYILIFSLSHSLTIVRRSFFYFSVTSFATLLLTVVYSMNWIKHAALYDWQFEISCNNKAAALTKQNKKNNIYQSVYSDYKKRNDSPCLIIEEMQLPIKTKVSHKNLHPINAFNWNLTTLIRLIFRFIF